MFFTPLLTLLTEAIKRTFDAEYPEPDFRNIYVSPEWPIDKANYPGIWVDFEPTQELEIVGVSHVEHTEPSPAGARRSFTRWRFTGHAVYTIVALTSLERARLFDEVVRVMAFGTEQAQTSEFRSYIQDNEFIAANMDFDQIAIAGKGETPGTPWDTDEIIYEISVQMEVVGEFVSDGTSQTLLPLRLIQVEPYTTAEPDPSPDPGGWM